MGGAIGGERLSRGPAIVAVAVTMVLLAGPAEALFGQGSGEPNGSRRGAASFPSVRAVRVAGARVVLDGKLDDAAWAAAPVATDFIQQAPAPGEAATERTEARILYDDEAVYVAVKSYDSRPDSIASQLGRRDGTGIYSDWVHVAIDSYYDRRTAYLFGVTPRGVKQDLVISNDRVLDDSWDAVWDVATSLDHDGWSAEFRIPLSQLRFHPAEPEGGRVWGFNVRREIARRREISLWAPVPPTSGHIVSLFGTLSGLEGLDSSRKIELLPYVSARGERTPAGGTDSRWEHGGTMAAGLDLKYGLTSGVTLTGAVNPDFGQVEADPSEVNLTAFETRLQERRPFFLEGANLFRYQGGGIGEQLFYSRRIGRGPQGMIPAGARAEDVPESATILGAVKASGQLGGGWSLAWMNAVTGAEAVRYTDSKGAANEATVEPLTNYGAIRLSRDFSGGRHTVGGMITSVNRKLSDPGVRLLRSSAYAGALAGQVRIGRYELTGSVVGSHIVGGEDAIAAAQRSSARYFQRPDVDHVRFDSTRTSLSGAGGSLALAKPGGTWQWTLEGSARSPGYEINDLGFQQNADYLNGRAQLVYQRVRAGRRVRQWAFTAHAMNTWNFAGESLLGTVQGQGRVVLTNNWWAMTFVAREFPGLSESSLRGGPALFRPGRVTGNVFVASDSRLPIQGQVMVGGAKEDAAESGESTVFQMRPTLTVRAAQGFDLSLSPVWMRTRSASQYLATRSVGGVPYYIFGELDQTTTSVVARLNAVATPTLTLQVYAELFTSENRFAGLTRVATPRARPFEERFRRFTPEEVTPDPDRGAVHLDVTGDGVPDTQISDPDFAVGRFRSSAVLRWEWRPGSTLFLIWTQGRGGRCGVGAEVCAPFGQAPTDNLMVKGTFWLNR